MTRFLALVLACSAAPVAAEVLRIGASPTYPPYLSRDSLGQLHGMDADLMGEICQRGGYDCRWIDTEVPALVEALAEGRIDVVTGGIGYSVARDMVIDFTCPYHVTEDAFGVFFAPRAGEPPAKTAIVAVTGQSLHEQAMTSNGWSTLAFETNSGAVEAVLSGRADAYFGSSGVVEAHPDGALLFEAGTHPIPTTGAALGVSEARPGLRGDLDGLLAEISADGTLAALQSKWLRVDQGDVIADCRKPLPLS